MMKTKGEHLLQGSISLSLSTCQLSAVCLKKNSKQQDRTSTGHPICVCLNYGYMLCVHLHVWFHAVWLCVCVSDYLCVCARVRTWTRTWSHTSMKCLQQ